MKMKEVTARTGLTERTVRFYMQKELIAPHGQWRNGREYTDFDEKDIAKLNAVATLRELGFGIEEIRSMQLEPDLIPELVSARRAAAKEENSIAQETERILTKLNAAGAQSIEELAERCRACAAQPQAQPPIQTLPLPKADHGNESGMGDRCRFVTNKIKNGWNWGAFLLSVPWGLANHVYLALLCSLPIIGLIMPFYLGEHGNELAWKHKYWENEEHFKRVQRGWAIAALVLLCLAVAILITAMIAAKNENTAAEERMAAFIQNVEADADYSALLGGRERWAGQIEGETYGFLDDFYVDPDGYYKIMDELRQDLTNELEDYGSSAHNGSSSYTMVDPEPAAGYESIRTPAPEVELAPIWLERTLIFSNGDVYCIAARADKHLNVAQIEITFNEDKSEYAKQEIAENTKIDKIVFEHLTAAEACFKQTQAWQQTIGQEYTYRYNKPDTMFCYNETGNSADTVCEGFSAYIYSNGSLYYAAHDDWLPGVSASGLKIYLVDTETSTKTLIAQEE